MKKRIISLLCAVLMLTAVCVPAFASDINAVNDENTSSVMRAPEYAHVNAYGVSFRAVEVDPYTAEKTPENNAIICSLNKGDCLQFINMIWGADGRMWVYGKLRTPGQFEDVCGYVLASYVNINSTPN